MSGGSGRRLRLRCRLRRCSRPGIQLWCARLTHLKHAGCLFTAGAWEGRAAHMGAAPAVGELAPIRNVMANTQTSACLSRGMAEFSFFVHAQGWAAPSPLLTINRMFGATARGQRLTCLQVAQGRWLPLVHYPRLLSMHLHTQLSVLESHLLACCTVWCKAHPDGHACTFPASCRLPLRPPTLAGAAPPSSCVLVNAYRWLRACHVCIHSIPPPAHTPAASSREL